MSRLMGVAWQVTWDVLTANHSPTLTRQIEPVCGASGAAGGKWSLGNAKGEVNK